MPTALSAEQMKAKVRSHFEEFVNQRNPQVIETNMTPGFYDHDGPGELPANLSGDERLMLGMYDAMPDLHLDILDMVAEGDKVVCRNRWRWTDRRTGQPMSFQGFVCWRFEGDRIAERWATVTKPSEHSSWDNEKAGE